jgi:putative redox protein
MANNIQIQIRQVEVSTSEAVIRGHTVLIDRPAAKGGADLGPMGGELFLAAVGGCFMSNLLAAVKARGVEVPGIHTEVTGTLAESPMRFVSVELCVSTDCPDQELVEKLVEIAERGCIMVNTLRGLMEMTVRIAEVAAQ